MLARAVEALNRFSTEPPWVLIGGVAVFIRLGSVTRPTADADTVARSQAELIDRLVADEPATVVTGGELEVPVGDGTIEIDVMDLADDPLPGDAERRAFALARRFALDTAVTERVVVYDRESVVVGARIPVASTAALVALKTVSMVRRPHGNSPHKIGSDIHDLVRLVAGGAPARSEQNSSPTPPLPRGSSSSSVARSALTSATRCSASAPTTARPAPNLSATPRSKRRASSPTSSPSSSGASSPARRVVTAWSQTSQHEAVRDDTRRTSGGAFALLRPTGQHEGLPDSTSGARVQIPPRPPSSGTIPTTT